MLLNNSAATCLELQQFEEALLHSSTVVLLQVADEGLISKVRLWEPGGSKKWVPHLDSQLFSGDDFDQPWDEMG